MLYLRKFSKPQKDSLQQEMLLKSHLLEQRISPTSSMYWFRSTKPSAQCFPQAPVALLRAKEPAPFVQNVVISLILLNETTSIKA